MGKAKQLLAGVVSVALISLTVVATPALAAKPEALPTVASVHAPHMYPTNDASRLRTTSSANLTYHNGPVMTAPVTSTAIYWGSSWANSTFTADKTSGINGFYAQYGGSKYAAIQAQYSQLGGAKVTSSLSVASAVTDTATTPSSVNTAVLNEVISQIPFSALSNDGYYPVYTDLPRGTAGYCAWHSMGSVTSGTVTKRIKFAFFFNLDGDTGCTPQVLLNNGYSAGAQALVNVSAHELAETLTDPELTAWFDSRGYENGDKCAWQFNSTGVTLQPGSNPLQLQGEWNNSITACSW